MRMTATKFKCKCGKEFDSMFAYSYHFEEGRKRIGNIKGEKVQYGVDGLVLQGQSGKDQLMMEFVADHQILRTNDEEYKRW
jgi:hypothetical protein